MSQITASTSHDEDLDCRFCIDLFIRIILAAFIVKVAQAVGKRRYFCIAGGVSCVHHAAVSRVALTGIVPELLDSPTRNHAS